MNAFLNIFRTKSCCRNLEFLPNPLGSLFEKFKVLITYNIYDTSMCKEIINMLQYSLSPENNITDYTPEELLIALRKEILNFYLELKSTLRSSVKKESIFHTLNPIGGSFNNNSSSPNYSPNLNVAPPNLQTIYQILNMTIFLYTLILSMRGSNCKLFYEIIFDKSGLIFLTLAKILEIISKTGKTYPPSFELLQFIANMFNQEGSSLLNVLLSFNLEELFFYNKKLILNLVPDLENYKQSTFNEISTSIYKKLLENIVNLDLCYEIIFHKNEFQISIDDKPLIKSIICQAILRIVFSQEKYKFIQNLNIVNTSEISSNISNDSLYLYEISFLKNLIKKCVTYYFEKFGENVNCLFRREEIFDELIKNIFFTNANFLFYRSLFFRVKRILDLYGQDIESEIENLSMEEFIEFYEDLLSNLKMNTPNIIKIILRLIYENVLITYKNKIKPENYSPVLTILFFNFLISPKMQEIYNIHPTKSALVKNMNRLIRNICFNEKFKEEDSMSYYNGIIEICHLHTRSAIEKIINSFLLEDMDYLLKSEIESNWQYVYTPIDVFYRDCELIVNKLEKSMCEENIGDISEEVDFIERMMKGRQKSFYLKINLEDFKKLKVLDQISSQGVTEKEIENW
jgi:hypothetical protein